MLWSTFRLVNFWSPVSGYCPAILIWLKNNVRNRSVVTRNPSGLHIKRTWVFRVVIWVITSYIFRLCIVYRYILFVYFLSTMSSGFVGHVFHTYNSETYQFDKTKAYHSQINQWTFGLTSNWSDRIIIWVTTLHALIKQFG